MLGSIRSAGILAAIAFGPAIATAATPKEIDAAIKKGSDSLKARYGRNGGPAGNTPDFGNGVGSSCLAGVALLEAGVPANDPAVKTITDSVRAAAYSQGKTYQVSLCLVFLDRLGDPADETLIQILAVRLVVSQTSVGGWGYDCVMLQDPASLQQLKAIQPGPVGKFNPEVGKYAQALAATRANPNGGTAIAGDDNSNTQFAILAVWLARKHGMKDEVEGALDLIEKRFRNSQSARTGGWGYNGPAAQAQGIGIVEGSGSPSMYCAGLLGLSTGIARREERRAKADGPKKDPMPKTDPGVEPKKSDDPFFTPPKGEEKPEPKKKPPARPLDGLDLSVQAAFAGLGAHVAESAKAGRGALFIREGGGHGRDDLYFFWSLERVGVIFGAEKIGGVDWYEAGATSLVHTQSQDGSWGGASGYGAEVSTSFAVLFLCRSNLARDLAGKVSSETNTEMKFGGGKGSGAVGGTGGNAGTAGKTNPLDPPPFVPGPTGSEAAVIAGELLKASERDWATVLNKLRDTKGTVYTHALVGAVYRLDGERRKSARAALAERLTRMTAETLRSMAKAEDAELRRGAVLAMAMKDEKVHVPDLIAALLDEEDLVVRAARAGLKSLTGEDFGPAPNASAGQKKLAVDSWTEWQAKQKK